MVFILDPDIQGMHLDWVSEISTNQESPLCGTGAPSMCRNRTGPVPGLGRSGGEKESDYLAVHPERSIGNCFP